MLRGKEGSTAKHLDTAEYKAKKIIESAESYAENVKRQNAAYEKALQGDFAKSKSGLKEQLAATTAKNENLMKRLDKSIAKPYNQRVEAVSGATTYSDHQFSLGL